MTDTQMLHAADKEIVGEIWTASSAYDNLVALYQTAEHRFYGSPGEKSARDFLLDLMRQYGLQEVHGERFDFEGWERIGASLEVTSPARQELECLALPGSPAGLVEGELLNLGHGTPGDYGCLADNIRGRVVMVTNKSPVYAQRRMHRVEKYMRAVQAGAINVIWARDEGGGSPKPAVWDGVNRPRCRPSAFPVKWPMRSCGRAGPDRSVFLSTSRARRPGSRAGTWSVTFPEGDQTMA